MATANCGSKNLGKEFKAFSNTNIKLEKEIYQIKN